MGSGSGKNIKTYNKGNQNPSSKIKSLNSILIPLTPKQDLSVKLSVAQTTQTVLPNGGRLHLFISGWSQNTKDSWILQVVSNHYIEFIETPF